ncbi:MAG: helix-turn-helix transcriptional regulator [Clostridia bacterium]|nr:helix-turn-helix transcriptional regulator [Clostridia bacterium]MBQ8382193.1 helix-turn-helix transcriptional regulator [Clostridia bacterium]
MKLVRTAMGLSKKEMANRIRISIYSLNKLESGIIPPRLCIDFLVYIHWEFGILPSEMFLPRLGLDADAPLSCHP